MPDSFDRNRIIHLDFAAVLVSRGDLFGRSVAIFHRTEWGREKREGRGYGAGHQGDLQALSHYRDLSLMWRRQTSPPHLATRNLTENS